MQTSEKKVYLAYFSILLIFLGIALFAADYHMPISETITCNSDYECLIEKQSRWSRETSNLTMCYGAKIKLGCSTSDLYQCSISFHGGGLGCTMRGDRIGTLNGQDFFNSGGVYVISSSPGLFTNAQNMSQKEYSDYLGNEFDNYMKGNSTEFTVTKKYNQKEFNIISLIITLFFITFCYAKVKDAV